MGTCPPGGNNGKSHSGVVGKPREQSGLTGEKDIVQEMEGILPTKKLGLY